MIRNKLVNVVKNYSVKNLVSVENSEKMAVSALTFLAGEPEHLGRFLQLSGLAPGDLAQVANDRGFLAAVLGFVVSDEALLGVFCQHHGHGQEDVDMCFQILNGPNDFG